MTPGTREPLLCITPVAPPTGGVALQTGMFLGTPEIAERFDCVVIRSNPPRTREDPRGGKRISPASILWSLGLFRKAFLAGRRARPRVVHVTTSDDLSFLRSLLAARLAGAGRRTGIVIHHHAQRGGYYTGPPRRNPVSRAVWRVIEGAARRLARRSAVVQLTEAIDRSYVGRGMPPAAAVIPNCVDCGSLAPPPGKLRGSLLFLGRQSRGKGFPELLEALAAPSLSVRDWTLDVLGEAPTAAAAAEVADLLRDHPSAARIRFHGTVTGDRKRDLLVRSSILVLPSRTEVFPVAIVEGMAAGMAVIASPVGEVEDIPAAEGWLPVRPGDAESLVRAISDLLSDPGRVERMGEANRRRAVAEYDLGTQAARLSAILTRAAEATGRPAPPGLPSSR